MKRYILLFFVLLSAIQLHAKEVSDINEPVQHLYATVNFQSGHHFAYSSPDFQFDMALGYRPINGFAVAAGFGGNANLGNYKGTGKTLSGKDWVTTVPVFLELTGYVPGWQYSPYMTVRGGYQFQFWNHSHDISSGNIQNVIGKDGAPVPSGNGYLQGTELSPDTFSPFGWFVEASLGLRQVIGTHAMYYGVIGGLTQYGNGVVFKDAANNFIKYENYQPTAYSKAYCVEGIDKKMNAYLKIKIAFEF